MVWGVFQARVFAWQNVSLAWNPSPDETVVAYNVYFGLDSGFYSQVLPVGNASAANIDGLAAGATYYFAVSAIDVDGNESPLSEEVVFTTPAPKPVTLNTELYTDENGQPYALLITGDTAENGSWELDYSSDLKNWSPYTYGYGGDMVVPVWFYPESESPMFFRLVSY